MINLGQTTNEKKNKDGWFIRANSIPSFIFFSSLFFFFLPLRKISIHPGHQSLIPFNPVSWLLLLLAGGARKTDGEGKENEIVGRV